MRYSETKGFESVPGTTAQVEALLNKLSKKGWEFLSFGDRRNDKGKVLPGTVVWVRRIRIPGHG